MRGPVSARGLWALRLGALAAVQLAAATGFGLAAVALAASSGGLVQMTVLLVIALAIGRRGVESSRAARRSACVARANRRARRAFRRLETHGWSVRHAVRWPWGGRLAHLAVAPTGALAFAIDSLAAAPCEADLDRVQNLANWLSRAGAPCVAVCAALGAEDFDELEAGVLVTDVERLDRALGAAWRGFERASGDQPSAVDDPTSHLPADPVAGLFASPSVAAHGAAENGLCKSSDPGVCPG